MSETLSLDIFHIFIFIIPGFITVWSFRYFTDSKKNSDFEYLALSLFWGLVMLLIYGLIIPVEKVSGLLKNPYAAAAVLSILGFFSGWLGSFTVPLMGKFLRWIRKKIING